MAKRNELHRHQLCERHQGDPQEVREKLNDEALTLVPNELNLHPPLNLASANDLPVRKQKVVRRFEEMRRTELVSQFYFTCEKLSTRDVISFSKRIIFIARFI